MTENLAPYLPKSPPNTQDARVPDWHPALARPGARAHLAPRSFAREMRESGLLETARPRRWWPAGRVSPAWGGVTP